jgi:hypothetical protein
MKCTSVMTLCSAMAAMLLAVAGCDGSGARVGIPTDLTPAASLDSLKADVKARKAVTGGSRKRGTTTGTATTKN